MADVDGGGGENDTGSLAGSIENELEAFGLRHGLDGIVHFVLNRLEQCGALLVQFAFGSEIFFLEVGSGLLFLHDFVLAIFLLCFRKEDSFVLIIAIKGLGEVLRHAPKRDYCAR